MELLQTSIEKGDWIVHLYYGVGQVEGKEEKILEGKEQTYLKVKTTDGYFWIPIEKFDCERIRPIASKNQIRYALKLIQEPPQVLPIDYKLRRKKILKAISDISLYSNVRMLRDLYYRGVSSSFNSYDNDALKGMKERFLNECTLVMGESREELERKLQLAFQTSMKKAKLKDETKTNKGKTRNKFKNIQIKPV
jgi:RNA polymerase-interacting CarD/CdnL/TRCF family regulator